MKAEIPHEQSRLLAAAGLGTDHAAVELMRQMTAEERAEVAGIYAEVRSRVGKLKEKHAARLSAELTQEEG